VISDQYRTKKVLTIDGRVISGVVSQQVDNTLLIRDSELKEHLVAEQDVDEILPSKQSLMPSGLLDELSAAEIRDLMTYLGFVPEKQSDATASSEVDIRR
jgi:putative heme-binding domain-containing protein